MPCRSGKVAGAELAVAAADADAALAPLALRFLLDAQGAQAQPGLSQIRLASDRIKSNCRHQKSIRILPEFEKIC